MMHSSTFRLHLMRRMDAATARLFAIFHQLEECHFPMRCRRLEALETFSDLGSGFNLAMQDLDIRELVIFGAGAKADPEDLGYEISKNS